MKHPSKCITKYCRRLHRQKSPICSRCSMRIWRAENPDHAKWAILRDRAARKRVPFDLTVGWLSAFLDRNEYDSALHHIDRIRAWEGYVMGNLQVLPCADNIAKGNRERWTTRSPKLEESYSG